MNRGFRFVLQAVLLLAFSATALVLEFEVVEGRIRLKGVSLANPVVYDNDFWTDVPDAVYVWAQASLGRCRLKGNIITRCTFDWEKGYAHELSQQIEEAKRLFALARESRWKGIPEPVIGAREALRRPASGRFEDTVVEATAGSDLLLREARAATPEQPLLVFVGGSCTTVAIALVQEPALAERMMIFQIDGGAYNGSDAWAWEIAMRRCRFVNWARGYFWDRVATWDPAVFDALPRTPINDFLREYARGGLGRANQWGDGAWLFELYAPGCLTAVEVWDGRALTVPREANRVDAMRTEFLRAVREASGPP